MEQRPFGYIGGIDKDSSKSKRDPNKLYDAQDVRIVTDEGTSTGSIVNEKGNSLAFKVPDLAEMYVDYDGDGINEITIPAQADLQIIGWGVVRDSIVMITTNETSETPVDSYGQIWMFSYDESTNTISGLIGNELDPTTHLKYNAKLNLSSFHTISRIVTRYETSDIIRAVWSDTYNTVRTVNLADPDLMNTNPTNVDILPAASFNKPIIQSIGSGSIPVGSVVQYAYKLIDSAGATTLMSPVSEMMQLGQSNPATTTVANYHEYTGATKGETTGLRSVTYSIENIDTDYESIEHYVIIYENLDAPKIYKFNEEVIPTGNDITITHLGDEDYIEISLAEFNLLSSGFDVCEDIVEKDNRLIAANVKTEKFEVDFDARAYRFNLTKQADLYDSQGVLEVSIDGNSPVWPSNETLDVINPFNDEKPHSASNQFKYQTDGATIGGEGPNVKYKFITTELTAYATTAPPNAIPFTKSNKFPTGHTIDFNTTDTEGDVVEYPIENQFKTFKSPFTAGLLMSGARGEVYRYGLEFDNKSGSPSIVKWIGDIKFPEAWEGFATGKDHPTSTDYINMLTVGIEITLDLSSLETKIRDGEITAVRVVRVKREEKDKTRLGTGILQFLEMFEETAVSLFHDFTGTSATMGAGMNIGGTQRDYVWTLRDRTGTPGTPTINPTTGVNSIVTFLSPVTEFYKQSGFYPSENDFIETIGHYSARTTHYNVGYTAATGAGANRDGQFSVYYRMKGDDRTHTKQAFEIAGQKRFEYGEYIDDNDSTLGPYIGSGAYVANTSYCKTTGADTHIPMGIGDRKQIMALKNSGQSDPYFEDISNITYDGLSVSNAGDWTGDPSSGAVEDSNTIYFKEVAYCRDRKSISQYGGDSYSARSKNQYISTGHYQPLTPQVLNSLAVANTISNDVYGGDMYMAMHASHYMTQYRNDFDGDGTDDPFGDYDSPDTSRRIAISIAYPCETPVNTELRQGNHWARSRDDSWLYTSEDFILNTVYSQQQFAEQKFADKDFRTSFTEEHSYRIWASDPKINGESTDSWRIFKANNYIDVSGNFGPIQRVVNFQDRLMFFQDSAFGVAAINQRSTVIDETGTEIVLGSGGVLDDYGYVSTTSGTTHKHSVVNSGNSLFYYDVRLKKYMRYNGNGNTPLSDVRGLSAFFDKEVVFDIIDTDNITKSGISAIGIHGVYDFRHNRVLMTFLNNKPVPSVVGGTTYNIGDVVLVAGIYYSAKTNFTASTPPLLPSADITNWLPLIDKDGNISYVNGFTVSYNEITDSFESFYNYKPKLYLQTGKRLLSSNPHTNAEAYVHNEGEYGEYYGQSKVESSVTLLLSPVAELSSLFDTIMYNSEVSLNDIDIHDETLSALKAWNEHQNGEKITLTVSSSVKRRFRTWRTLIPRFESARMRGHNIFLQLYYQNNNNKKLILHDIILGFRPTKK